MQWAWEGMKLQAAVKHLSWMPPWVEAEDLDGRPPVGQCFMEKFQVERAGGRREWTRGLVPDPVGLGRFPSLWWTQNPHYHAAFDVQRFDAKGISLSEFDEGSRRGRAEFVRESGDLVAQLVAVR
eukprot:6651409-Pyramimonas_sp.AAC.1